MSGHYTEPGTRCRSRPSMRAHSAGWLAGTVDRDDDGGRPCWWSVGPVGRLVEGLSRPVLHAHLPRRAAAPVVCWWRGGAGGEWWAGRAERSLTRGGPERDGALRLQRCWDRPMGTWRPLSTKVLYAWDLDLTRKHAPGLALSIKPGYTTIGNQQGEQWPRDGSCQLGQERFHPNLDREALTTGRLSNGSAGFRMSDGRRFPP